MINAGLYYSKVPGCGYDLSHDREGHANVVEEAGHEYPQGCATVVHEDDREGEPPELLRRILIACMGLRLMTHKLDDLWSTDI